MGRSYAIVHGWFIKLGLLREASAERPEFLFWGGKTKHADGSEEVGLV